MGIQHIKCQLLWPLDTSFEMHVVFAAVAVFLAVVSICANASLICALHKTKQLSSFSNIFMTFVCSSDLCFSLINEPMIAVYHLLYIKKENCLVDHIQFYLAYFFLYFSGMMIMAVAIDRYLHITKLLRYDSYMNKQRATLIVVTSFAVSNTAAFSLTYWKASSFEIQLAFFAVNMVLNSTIFYCYFIVIGKVSFSPMQDKLVGSAGCEMSKRRKASIRTMRLLIIAVMMAYGPYNILTVTRSYYVFYRKTMPNHTLDVLTAWSYFIVFSFSIINVVIYSSGNTEIKSFYKKMIHCVQKENMTASQEKGSVETLETQDTAL